MPINLTSITVHMASSLLLFLYFSYVDAVKQSEPHQVDAAFVSFIMAVLVMYQVLSKINSSFDVNIFEKERALID